MIIIYDFDGTLTPFSLPQYKILKENGYDDEKLMVRVKEEMKINHESLYRAYFNVYKAILEENHIPFTIENACLGANEVVLNPGIIEYFKSFQKNIKHYVISSGLEIYVKKTKIFPFLEEVYGTTFENRGGIFTDIKRLVTDEEKVTIIKEILSKEANQFDRIIYIGDGLTDQFAFKYVKSIGGKTIFVGKNLEDNSVFKQLKELDIIDEGFDPCYDKQSKLYQYIKKC